MIGFIVCSMLPVCCALTVSAVRFERTIVAMSKGTAFGENIFLRGESSKGPVPIRHQLKTLDAFGHYAMMSTGDRFLSWGGAEETQWKYLAHIEAQGTPMMHTTNDHSMDENVDRNGTTLLQYIGENLWIADFYMNCDGTDDGWFQFKDYMTDLRDGHQDYGWEGNVITSGCTIDGTDIDTPNNGYSNHNAKCGYFNLAIWENAFCISDKLDYSVMQFRYAWKENEIS